MFRLAWRNLWRNRTRTLITGSAVALSLALQLMSFGIADSTYEKMKTGAVRTAGGSVLVHAKGYWDSRASDIVLRDGEATRAALAAVDGVDAVLPRLLVTGLVSSARGNKGVMLMGIEPAREAKLNDMSRFLAKGRFLDGDTKNPIVLDVRVVRDLKLDLGDRVVVTATDPAGEITRLPFRLAGVVDTGSELVEAVGYTRLDVLQSALSAPDTVTQLGVLLTDDAGRRAVQGAVKAALGPQMSALEALTWDEAMPELVGFIEIDKNSGALFGALIFIVVAFGIANTFLMAVLERIRELGLLAALGLTPGRVARLVVIEAMLLGAISIGVGVALAFGLHVWIASVGIDWSDWTGGEMEISGVVLEDMVIYSKVELSRWINTAAAVFALIVASALYPAWRATRMDPAAAMRTYT